MKRRDFLKTTLAGLSIPFIPAFLNGKTKNDFKTYIFSNAVDKNGHALEYECELFYLDAYDSSQIQVGDVLTLKFSPLLNGDFHVVWIEQRAKIRKIYGYTINEPIIKNKLIDFKGESAVHIKHRRWVNIN